MGNDRRPIREILRIEYFLFLITNTLHARQQILFISHAGESRLIEQDLGKNYRRHGVDRNQRSVNRQLRFGQTILGPVADIDGGTGLVVDDDAPPVCQLIDAVDHHFYANLFDLDFGRLLAGDHGKTLLALGLNGQPLVEQARQTTRFQFPKTKRQRDVASRFKIKQCGCCSTLNGWLQAGFKKRGQHI